MKRKNLGKGLGKGYRNILNTDPQVHSLSARGVKTKKSIDYTKAVIPKIKLAEDLSPEEYKGYELTFHKKKIMDEDYIGVKSPELTDKEFLTVGKSKDNAFIRARTIIDNKIKEKDFKKRVKKFKFPEKKLFYYKIIKSNPRYYGGRNETAEIFEHTPTGMRRVGETKWNTAGYKGEESEIGTALVEFGKLKPEHLDRGYYRWTDAEKMNYKIERL
jgi:hypothetical protein